MRAFGNLLLAVTATFVVAAGCLPGPVVGGPTDDTGDNGGGDNGGGDNGGGDDGGGDDGGGYNGGGDNGGGNNGGGGGNNDGGDDDFGDDDFGDDDFGGGDDEDEDDTGAFCSDNADCDTACLFGFDEDGNQTDFGYCTKPCESFADCPTFWDCEEVGNAVGTFCIQD
jgi:hypothetical protein